MCITTGRRFRTNCLHRGSWLFLPALVLCNSLLFAQRADLVLHNGNILTVDTGFTRATSLAIKDGKILAVGTRTEVRPHIGATTSQLDLHGKTVLPGLIETHVHAIGAALATLNTTYVQLSSIPEIQKWLRTETQKHPPGTWIRVPRADITRLAERRHPTPQELDQASPLHPVVFTAARKNVLNTLALEKLGITAKTDRFDGGKVILDRSGKPLLLTGGNNEIRKQFPTANYSQAQRQQSLLAMHRRYNAVGITSIFERANNKDGYQLYTQLHEAGKLTLRSTHTIRQQFRSGDQVSSFTAALGLMTGQGNDWVRVGPLKITVDGGIHWGTTHLREPYGPRRIQFYGLNGIQDPAWQGNLSYPVELMAEIFRAGHKLGWQMCCHVTGDAGVDKVLEALEKANRDVPLTTRRFTLTHAYFPALDSIKVAQRLGVCVDTQPYLYYKDSAAMGEVYGPRWAERFIGLGDWMRGKVPTAINSDHMIGTDPNHSMNSFNPFLLMSIAVRRHNDQGKVLGAHQKISRRDAIRSYTSTAAYLSFDETRKGSLEPGKLADLIIIDRDILNCAEKDIEHTRVLRTMVDGKFVYTRK